MPIGLSQRAEHPAEKLHLLHGSLFDVRCTSFYCDYAGENFDDPIAPALDIPKESIEPKPSVSDKTGAQASKSLQDAMTRDLDISDDRVEIPELAIKDLPLCPKCSGLLRPGVVWFGEVLPEKTLTAVDSFIESCVRIDLIMVIGTASRVFPAAGYIDEAREKGARVAVINMDRGDIPAGGLGENDWFFEGDAGEIIPHILESVIGDMVMNVRGVQTYG